MRVIFNKGGQHKLDCRVVVALGNFDGVHRGHQELVKKLNTLKEKYGCSTMIYTFKQHPMAKLAPEQAPPQIMSLGQKIDAFKREKIDFLVLNDFDESFSRILPEEFVDQFLLDNYNIHSVVVGYNFRFGYQGKGDTVLLKKLARERGFNVIVVPPVKLVGKVVSSSLIRHLIQEGDIEKANFYLGYPYTISGKVTYGYGRGQTIGYPTANLDFNRKKAIPKYGVYITRAYVRNKVYWGVTNIGMNPTFNNKGLYLETHLLAYRGNLYGQRLSLEFMYRIRDEKRFKSVKELRQQIQKDVEEAQKFIYKFRRI